LLILLSLVFADWAYGQESDLTEDTSFLRVTIDGKTVRLEGLVVKRTDATGRLPIALIAHGKSSTQGRMLDTRASFYLRQARDLARRGWLAVVVIRRGFGGSDGPSPVPLSCASKSLIERFSADADDLEATINLIAQRPDADASRVIAIGVSAGGAAVTAWSARNPEGLVGVVNVSGGLRFPDRCPKENELVSAFKAFGAKTRVPSLWVYAKNDSLFHPDLVRRMHAAFLQGGGDVKLVMLEPDRGDGHFIFSRASGRLKWLHQMDAFLRYHKLPTWSQEDVNALMQKLAAKEGSRGFVENYMAAPSERALARQKSGSYMYASFSARTLGDARKSALEHCERKMKPCEILMENDRWRGQAQ
jgi:dienelactone hydrolase